MTKSDEESGAGRKRRVVVAFMVPLFFGLTGLLRVMESPQFPTYRTLHVVQLLLSGACFGGLLLATIFMLLRPRR